MADTEISVEDLRRLVRDQNEAVFEDEDLLAAINAAGGSILRAAGIAFQGLAAQYAAIGRSIKTDDLAIDVRSRGRDLLEVAKSFFNEARAADDTGGNDFIQIVPLAGRGGGFCVRPEGTPRPCCGSC